MKTLKLEIPDGFQIDSLDKETGTIKLAPIPKDITERVQSVEDAIEELGENDEEVIELRKLQKAGVADHILGNQELIVKIKALNEGWVADWQDNNQIKWFPWFDFDDSSSAGRFSFCASDDRYSTSLCGFRLCLKSERLSDYAGKQFIETYRKVYTQK